MDETRNRKDRITTLVLFVFSLIYLYGCLRLKIGRVDNPGPGFMPLVVGTLLLVFTSFNLLRSFQGRASAKGVERKDASVIRNLLIPLGTLASVVAYPFLLMGLKFVFATFLVMFAMLVINKYKSVALNAIIALVIALVSFVFFSMILGVVLPMGKLEALILQLR